MNKRQDLQGNTAIITGGSQGLGAATARLFAERGVQSIVICGRQTNKGEQVAAEIQSDHPHCQVHFVTIDLAQADAAKQLIDAAKQHFQKLHIVVNVAGLSARGSILDTSVELYDQIMNINVRAPFFIMQEASRWMRETSSEGSIVNIGSIAAYAGMPILSAYCTSKGALNTLTRNTAHALMRDRIRVNCLNIGWMASDEEDLVQRKYHGAEDGWQEKVGATLPFGRLVDPNEVARAIAFLASEESGLMTGSVVNFDQSVWAASDAMVVPEAPLPDA
ncbi:MAG: SDR family oxidoreductase [Gammaproteobacteria bacterium]|nr:SDR family oxidoreductase [Gammaproteobacteria bacterium]